MVGPGFLHLNKLHNWPGFFSSFLALLEVPMTHGPAFSRGWSMGRGSCSTFPCTIKCHLRAKGFAAGKKVVTTPVCRLPLPGRKAEMSPPRSTAENGSGSSLVRKRNSEISETPVKWQIFPRHPWLLGAA